MNFNDIKISTPRSSRFPSISLDFSIQVVTEARKFGRDLTNVHLAGGGSVTGGAFDRKKASLGYFKLTERRGNIVHITDLAEKIINPFNEEEKKKAIQTAFLSPELFQKLYQTVTKNTPINLNMLGNLLVREYAIQPSARGEFISTLIRSGIFAGLIKYSDDNKSEVIFLDRPGDSTIEPQKPVQTATEKNQGEEKSQVQTVELILSAGKAKIIVPKDLTTTDAKRLKAQIDILANIFDDTAGSA